MLNKLYLNKAVINFENTANHNIEQFNKQWNF